MVEVRIRLNNEELKTLKSIVPQNKSSYEGALINGIVNQIVEGSESIGKTFIDIRWCDEDIQWVADNDYDTHLTQDEV